MLPVRAVAVQNIMGAVLKDAFCLNVRKTTALIFVENVMNSHAKKTSELFEEQVYEQWLKGNQEIRDHGIELFWSNNSEKPHYKPYKFSN